ncbi:MAG TPA: DNA/RNA non-specific endonuclease [Candidatus Alistipes pullicola]|nr:DNA/RNA non-specific endonuclease [Candidatus Alistipes pullicola]
MKKRNSVKISKRTYRWVVLLLAVLVVVLAVTLRRTATTDRGTTLHSRTEVRSDNNSRTKNSAEPKRKGSTTSAPAKDGKKNLSVRPTTVSVDREGLELPAIVDDEFVLRNKEGQYTLLYDTTYRQAAWVAYRLTRTELEAGSAKRSNSFRSDPQVLSHGWPAASDSDYKGSGYDRGHLLPSADRCGSSQENRATFLLSNISPQRPELNRGVWRLLEEQVRRWALQCDTLYIVTGSNLNGHLPRIRGGVGVPEQFFKAILLCSDSECQAIAFLIPNEKQLSKDFFTYALSIDSLEDRLHMDLFPVLPDEVETRVESRANRPFWRNMR